MKPHPQDPCRFLISCLLALNLSSAVLHAEQTPVPSVTPSLPGATGMATPAELHPAVRAVGIHDWKGEARNIKAIYAQRGDEIWIDVRNFRGWLDSLGEKLPKDHEVKDLILYLDHFPLLGVSPIYWYETKESTPTGNDGKPSQEYTVTTVGFSLVRNDISKPGWSHLLNQPVLKRKVIVSVGFSNGAEIDSEMTPDGKRSKEFDQEFFLTVIPNRSAFGFVIILIALLAFIALARRTHIVRDTAAPRRPDGLRPYSLARGQMAFWFFLVIASYFFLWIVTGDMDTLNTSVLGLVGISAGTALGSAFIDASKPALAGSSGNEPTVDVTKPRLEVLAELRDLQARTQKKLQALQKARAAMSSSDKHGLEENEREQNELREMLANYRWQGVYFAWPTWKGVMYDLLAENNLISFHRFQIFVWTLVLGFMFVASVYNELKMPEFSATLLGLLGISAGTYVGFKLPETKPQ